VLAKKAAILGLGLTLGGFSYHLLRGQDSAAPVDGVYTVDQAHHGETLYQVKCVSCHAAALDGTGPYPPLSGDEFLSKYEGQPVLTLYDMIQKLMPADKPGSLSRPDAADLVAYILSFNKFPAGKTALPSEENSLKTLTLPKPAPKT
jgi:S-disulfanyl-L-cysteine oxidoreductase SoxD